jgi:TatD DNase family protein
MGLEKLSLIDTHSHLHFPLYTEDLAFVLARMTEKRIGTLTVGTTLENSEKAVAFAEAHENVWAVVGLHPEHLTSSYHDAEEGEHVEMTLDVERLEKIARSSQKVVAIGEVGLDFHQIEEGMTLEEAQVKQEAGFLAHIDVASRLNLPLVIHCREVFDRIAEILREAQAEGKNVRGVVHSFTGTWAQAQTFLELGFFIGVNGIATFPPKKQQDPATVIDRTIEKIPLDRLLLETDAPFLAPVPFRGKRNEPAYVEEVARHVARVRGMTLEGVARQTTENARMLFGIS